MKSELGRFIQVQLALIALFAVSCGSGSNKSTPMKAMSIYEVNLRQFSHSGRLAALTKEADRLWSMSVDAVILPPLQPIGKRRRMGELGSPFAVSSFKEYDLAVIGNKEHLRRCVQTFHGKDIKVYMDWHPMICAVDHEWFEEHKDWKSSSDVTDVVSNPFNFSLTDVYLLDWSNPDLQRKMYEAMKHWIEVHQIDGFRIYEGHLIPDVFWDKYASQLQATFIAAREHADLHPIFMASMNYALHDNSVKLFQRKIDPEAFIDFAISNQKGVEGRTSINFTSNIYLNATQGSDYMTMGSYNRMLAVLAFTTGGIPMLTSGQEEPISVSLDLYNRDQIDWAGHVNDDFYRQLFLLKKRNKALIDNLTPLELIPTNNPNFLAFRRQKDGHVFVGIFNLTKETQRLQVGENIFNMNHYITFNQINLRKDEILDLGPLQYLVLSNV